MNAISSTLFYDQRIVISEPIKTPITWEISKVENMNPKGVVAITFSQNRWNEHTDVFEYEDNSFSSMYFDDKKIVGMWADYNKSEVTPTQESTETRSDIYSVISYSGTAPTIKSGGSYKKFTVDFYDGESITDFENGKWSFYIKNKLDIDANDLISSLTINDSGDVKENQIKVKLKKDDSLIGDVLIVEYKSDSGIVSNIEVEILGL